MELYRKVTDPYLELAFAASPFVDEPTGLPGAKSTVAMSEALRAELQAAQLPALYLNYTEGWACEDYSFLRGMPWLRLLSLVALPTPVPRLESLAELEDLEHLSINCKVRGSVELGHLPLVGCFLEWWRGAASIFRCRTLECLSLSGIRSGDLAELGQLSASKKLTLRCRDLDSVGRAGIPAGVEVLRLVDCRALESLEGIERLQRLRALQIDGSPKLSTLENLGALSSLEFLLLSDVGQVPSVRPIARLRKLRVLGLWGPRTKVLDGDLSCLEELRELCMLGLADRRHYSHRAARTWNWNDLGPPRRVLEPK